MFVNNVEQDTSERRFLEFNLGIGEQIRSIPVLNCNGKVGFTAANSLFSFKFLRDWSL